MKKLISVVLSLLILMTITGCGNKYPNGEVQIFLPGEYHSSDMVSAFEKEYGIKVNITTFVANEDMYTKLLGDVAFDIVIPSDYMIERLINEKMVQKLDHSKLTCLDNLYEGVKNMDYDPNNDYSVPYFWGNTGIVYDPTIIDQSDVEQQGWAVLKNPKYKGEIYMYDSVRDMFMVAEKNLGYSMNTSDPKELEDAYNWLCDIKRTMKPDIQSDKCIDGLATGEKAMGFMYSGDAAYIISENEKMKYYSPDGANYWVDAMCILNNANNVENAYKFINYVTDYEGALENSSYVGYASVNKDVLKDLTAAGADYDGNEAYIPREKTVKDEVFHNNPETQDIINEYWTKVKLVKED